MSRARSRVTGRVAGVLGGASAMLLSGCINMSGLGGGSKYACAAPEGIACDSMSGVYANAVHNNLPGQRRPSEAGQDRPTAARPQPGPRPAGSAREVSFVPATKEAGLTLGDGASTPSPTLRSGAQVLRLWTKAWEDADGDLWDQGYVYVQVSSGRWEIEHVRQRTRERYAPLRPPPATSGSAPSPALMGREGMRSEPDPSQRPSASPEMPQFPSLNPPGGRAETPTQ